MTLLLTPAELQALTGTKQPKRQADWLKARGWQFEPASRRGECPKVGRAYAEARMAGLQMSPDQPRRVAPSADWMLARKAA